MRCGWFPGCRAHSRSAVANRLCNILKSGEYAHSGDR